MVKLNKELLRTSLRNNRNNLSKEIQTKYSTIISNTLLDELESSTHIAMYMSYHNEVQTHEIIAKLLLANKHVYLPKVVSEGIMKFYEIHNLEQLVKNNIEILEPKDNLEYLGLFDIIVIPLVGFDAKCNRIGQGKGYYDRFLSNNKAIKIGLAYECQKADNIEIEQHDIPLNKIITEVQIYH